MAEQEKKKTSKKSSNTESNDPLGLKFAISIYYIEFPIEEEVAAFICHCVYYYTNKMKLQIIYLEGCI